MLKKIYQIIPCSVYLTDKAKHWETIFNRPNRKGVSFRNITEWKIFIGDVLKWLGTQNYDAPDADREVWRLKVLLVVVSWLLDLSAPIDENDDAIEYVYSLLPTTP